MLKGLINMSDDYHQKLEADALLAGGQAGGEYLESIEQTDLAELTSDQWEQFLRRVLSGFSESLQAVYEMDQSDEADK